jgi:hypothetical protein
MPINDAMTIDKRRKYLQKMKLTLARFRRECKSERPLTTWLTHSKPIRGHSFHFNHSTEVGQGQSSLSKDDRVEA